MATYHDDEYLTTYQAVAFLQRSERWLGRHSYHTEEEHTKRINAKVQPLIFRYKAGLGNRYKFSDLKAILGHEG